MAADVLVVPRAPTDAEDLWRAPEVCLPARLRRSGDAAPPRLATSVAAWFDADRLSVLFSGADDHVVARHFERDAPLYEEDVVEVFLAPAAATVYFELEVSPKGTLFDARIESPDGERSTMRADRAWDCEGLFAAVRTASESGGISTLDILLRIPFAALDRATPAAGETWRANFFRIDRHPVHGDEFSAWQPTFRTPPDFHVTGSFGTLRFA